MRMRTSGFTWAGRTLRRQGMPPEEVEAVLRTDDPRLLRRHMELHREWLGERLADELRTLESVERFLALAMLGRSDRLVVEERPVAGAR